MYRSSTAYREGRDAYGKWFDAKGSTCIDGTEPDNPYPRGSQEHEDWNWGRWDEKQECVLVEMGR